jgi:cytochrome c peroxidase
MVRTFWGSLALLAAFVGVAPAQDALDLQLARILRQAGFTGRIESQLEVRLGRELNDEHADLGRKLFFDPFLGIKMDNACAGCHSPTAGFGDTQSIAIGIDNNNLVGPNRAGPRNQRRTPMVLNTVFFPALMWNSRFNAGTGDPFDNTAGFNFPDPEGVTLSYLPHLMTAQAFIPPTERNEMAGFDFPGTSADLRAEVIKRLNENDAYRSLFADAFELGPDESITYDHLATAVAEFQFSLTFADAPIDQYARGEWSALKRDEKRGAVLFFGKAGCVSCHAVAGKSNEMFSDFKQHVIGVPQISPKVTDSVFDGPRNNEDFGLEQVTGKSADRYMFRTSPLRNCALQPTFFHNGAFTRLEDAIAHHLNPPKSALKYSPVGRLDADLAGPVGPIAPVLARLDKKLRKATVLSSSELRDLVAFVRYGLLDERALPENLNLLIPAELPSGLTPLEFETGD